jgi:hypothetical protein
MRLLLLLLLLLLFQDRSFEVHPVRRSAASWDRKCVPWVFRAASRAEARAWTDVIKRIAAALKSSPPLSESLQWSYHPTSSSSSRRSSEEPGEEEHRKLKTQQLKEPVKQHLRGASKQQQQQQRRSHQPKQKQPERWESEVDELFSGGSGSTPTALTKKAKSGKTTRGARRLNTKTKEQQQQQRSQQQQQKKVKAKTNSPQWTAEVDELFGSPLVRPPPRQ